jgi:exonuclease SbcD
MITHPEVVTIPGLEGVALACVPFIPLTAVADLAADDPARFEGSYADGIRNLNDRLLDQATKQAGPRGVVLYAAHLHVHGARPGRSERRITVGEDYATHVEGLYRAMYSALGHIHDPQLLPGGTVTGRYAGSIIPLDFGEAVQEKQGLVITISDGDVSIDEHPLPAGRPLTEFSGTIDELDALAANGGLNGHILKARVLSADPITDLAEHVLELSPECAIFQLDNAVTNAPVKPIDTSAEPEREPDIRELFNEWRTTVARGITAPHEDVTAMFSRAVESELDTGSELGIREPMSAAQGALDELARARGKTASQET